MPRYHFNVYDGRSSIGSVGTDLPNSVAARHMAIRYAGEILNGDAHRINPGEDWRMEVTDTFGLIYFTLDFHISEAPVVRGGKDARDKTPT